MNCPHTKSLLLHLGAVGVDKGWVLSRYHTETYSASYSSSIPGMCVAGKLSADETYCPPDYKRSAGRPSKKRKDRAKLRSTTIQRECKACGELGHFAISCPNPSTEYRFKKHKEKALLWCKAQETIAIE